MKKIFAALFLVLTFMFCAVACSKEEQKPFPSDEEIMDEMAVYLEDSVFMDPAVYASMNDFLNANFGLGTDNVSDAVLYMGAPNQNTTFFLMLTKAENADTQFILDMLERKMDGQVRTAEMGYMMGSTAYAIIEKENKIFVIMHEDPESFAKMQTYLNNL